MSKMELYDYVEGVGLVQVTHGEWVLSRPGYEPELEPCQWCYETLEALQEPSEVSDA